MVCFAQPARSVRLAGLRVLDLVWAQGAADGNLARVEASVSTTAAGPPTRDVEDVKLTAGCALRGPFFVWIMLDLVAVDDVVVPVPRAQSCSGCSRCLPTKHQKESSKLNAQTVTTSIFAEDAVQYLTRKVGEGEVPIPICSYKRAD